MKSIVLITLATFAYTCKAQKPKFDVIMSPHGYSIKVPSTFHEKPHSDNVEWAVGDAYGSIAATVQDFHHKLDDNALKVLLSRSNDEVEIDKETNGIVTNVHITQRLISTINGKKTYSEIYTYYALKEKFYCCILYQVYSTRMIAFTFMCPYSKSEYYTGLFLPCMTSLKEL